MVERVPFLSTLKTLKFLNLDPSQTMASYGRPDSLDLLYTQSGVPINVMICYETEFGDHTRRKTLMGAEWMAVITNDGWWRQSSGYIQHAGMSILRAIENRRALARCANNGRSMVIDAKGNVLQETNWWEEAVIDAEIPLLSYKTFYVRHGDYIGQIAVVLTILLTFLGIILHYYRKKQQGQSPKKDEN
jgi:apolipoprotein N-acyltransferase